MRILSGAYQLFNILSMDVAFGATITCAAFCIYANIPATLLDYFVLGNAVWIIYTLDHLYDARFSAGVPYSQRRMFHVKYRNPLTLLLIFTVILQVAVMVYNSFRLVVPALPAVFVTGFYLISNWLSQRLSRKFYIKELTIAAGYSLGIFAIPASRMPPSDWFPQLIGPGSFVFLTALSNVLVIARFERDADKQEQQISVAGWISNSTLRNIIWAVVILQFLAQWFFIPLIGFLMVTCMGLTCIFPAWFSRKERYRMIADGAFLVPLLFLLYRIFYYL